HFPVSSPCASDDHTTIDALHKVLTPALMHHPVPETAQLPQIPAADRNLIRGQDPYFGIPSIATIASLDCRLFTELIGPFVAVCRQMDVKDEGSGIRMPLLFCLKGLS
ncbi:hypothetical protein DM02DRAFT_620120, partial [Periconia macrospinosa]